MITDKPKETLGSAAIKAAADYNPDQTIPETKDAMLARYPDELRICAKRGEAEYGPIDHFYLVVITKAERLLPNVIRNFFLYRKSRPIPDYDTALYYYDRKAENITFVWQVPNEATVDYFTGYYEADDNGHLRWIPPAIPKKGEEQLAEFCKLFKECRLI